MKLRKIVLIKLMLLGISNNIYAENNINLGLITRENQELLVKKMLHPKTLVNTEYKNNIDKININHPLWIFTIFKKDIAEVNNQNIKTFKEKIKLYKNTFLEKIYEKKFLKSAEARKMWSDIIEVTGINKEIKDREKRCIRLKALIGLEEISTEISKIAKQNKCKVKIILQKPKDHNLFLLAIMQNHENKKKINIIKRSIKSPSYRTAVEEYENLWSYPKFLILNKQDIKEKLVAQADKYKILVQQAIIRAFSKDFIEAKAIFDNYIADNILNKQQIVNIANKAIQAYIKINKKPEKISIMDFLYKDISQENLEYIARQNITKKDYFNLEKTITYMSEENRNLDIWNYWKYRCLSEKGMYRKALEISKELSMHISFYGFLIAQEINSKFNQSLEDYPKIDKQKEEEITNRFKKDIARIASLLKIESRRLAQQYWSYILKKASISEKHVLHKISITNKWYGFSQQVFTKNNTIRSLRNIHKNLQKIFTNVSQKLKINYWDIVAIAKQESQFNPNAVSKAGAVGMLQVLPKTGIDVANRNKISIRNGAKSLLDIRKNIEIGATYLKELLGAFKNNRILAFASYNAGKKNTLKWIEASKNIDVISFIESISYKETRYYVKNVLFYSAINNLIKNKRSKLFEEKEILYQY